LGLENGPDLEEEARKDLEDYRKGRVEKGQRCVLPSHYVLTSILSIPGFWIFLLLEALLFLDIYAMRKPEMVTGLVRRLFRLFLRPLHMIQQLS